MRARVWCGALLIVTLFVTRVVAAESIASPALALDYPSSPLTYPIEPIKGAPAEMQNKAVAVAGASSALDMTETETEIKISLLGDILFDFDKAEIRSAAEPTLTEVVAVIQKHPKAKILIEGHTDAKGKPSYNAKLSKRRAASVKAWLAGKAVAGGRMSTSGWGAEKPVAENTQADGSDNPDGRQKNRRVELTIKK